MAPDGSTATNPENGTVTYTDNANKALAARADAKGQVTKYFYDGYLRLEHVEHWVNGFEDLCQRMTYTYDYSNYGGYTGGRLASAQYGGATCAGQLGFTEYYGYSMGGLLALKRLEVESPGSPNRRTSFAHVLYGYNNEGQMTGMKFPEILASARA